MRTETEPAFAPGAGRQASGPGPGPDRVPVGREGLGDSAVTRWPREATAGTSGTVGSGPFLLKGAAGGSQGFLEGTRGQDCPEGQEGRTHSGSALARRHVD